MSSDHDNQVTALQNAYRQIQEKLDRLLEQKLNTDREYREALAEAERDAEHICQKLNQLLGTSTCKLHRRRKRVLELLYRGLSWKNIAEAVSATVATVQHDAIKLRSEGLYPIQPSSTDDKESRRHNRVLWVWENYRSVRAPRDLLPYVDANLTTIVDDLRWLVAHDYVHNFKEDPTDDDDETAAQPGDPPAHEPARPLPPTETAKPRPDLAPKSVSVAKKVPSPHVATSAELVDEIKARTSLSGSTDALLTTTIVQRHSHVATVSRDGNGQTIADDAGHGHRVSKFCIMSSSKHTHDFILPQ